MKQSIQISAWSQTAPLFNRNLDDFISTLRIERERIPFQYRRDAAISLEIGENNTICAEIYYCRFETNEECKEREEKEAWKARRKQNEQATNAKYQQYLKLKKLFEDN